MFNFATTPFFRVLAMHLDLRWFLFPLAFLAAEMTVAQDIQEMGLSKPAKLSGTKPQELLAGFRANTVQGSHCLQVSLTHLPQKGPQTRYTATIWASQTPEGTRIQVDIPIQGSLKESISLLLIAGAQARGWIVIGDALAKELDEKTLYASLLPPLLYRPFDLLMPFIYWPNTAYEGVSRLKGRTADFFKAIPPWPETSPYSAVILGIDRGFKALLRAEYVDKKGQRAGMLEVLDFKQSGDYWIFQSIDLVEYPSRERSRLVVEKHSAH